MSNGFYTSMKSRFSNKLKVPWLSSKKLRDSQVPTKTNSMTSTGLNNINLATFPQPQWTRFEGANPWTPEQHIVLYCMNDQDNVPARMKSDEDFVFYVSQSRSPGHKDQGQDCMATASHGNWQVRMLCDGHDKLGHMVALGVCQQLPRILLRMLTERSGDANAEVSDKLINNAFDECSRVVCWTSEGITVGIWVKVFEGQWAEKPGYVKESSAGGKVRVAIIDENGYHLPPIDRKMLRRPRYTGGCTCVCLIRNKVTKECKIAVSGDSRIVVFPAVDASDPVFFRQPGVVMPKINFTASMASMMSTNDQANSMADIEDKAGDQNGSDDKKIPEGLITPAHNVFNQEERERLAKDYPGQYEFDGNFLVNPITKFAIQPTRGFGDFDMFGTGYTHVPEITKPFKLLPNSVIFAASDGVFDTHVWLDEEIITCLDKYLKDGLTTAQIVDHMYRETLQRSLEGGYVDDISIFCYKEPKSETEVVAQVLGKEEEEMEEMSIPTPEVVKKKKDTKDKRRTIGRGNNTFSDLSAQLLQKRQELGQKIKPTKSKAKSKSNVENDDSGDLEEFELSDDEMDKFGYLEKTGELMKSIAASKGLKDFEKLDPKELVKAKSFSALDTEEETDLKGTSEKEKEDDSSKNDI